MKGGGIMNKLYVKVRCKKTYKEATTHVCVGEVIHETEYYLKIRGVIYSFRGKHFVSQKTAPKIGPEGVYWFPWESIAVVQELPVEIDWRKMKFEVIDGALVLVDKDNKIVDKLQ